MWTWTFWKQALERALKTAAQAPLTVWVVGDGVLNALTLDWELGLGVAAGGFVSSILFSVASATIGESSTPSLVEEAPIGRHEG